MGCGAGGSASSWRAGSLSGRLRIKFLLPCESRGPSKFESRAGIDLGRMVARGAIWRGVGSRTGTALGYQTEPVRDEVS